MPIDWTSVCRQPGGFIPTRLVLEEQCLSDGLSVERVFREFTEQPFSNKQHDGSPREFRVVHAPPYYQDLMRHPEMLRHLAQIPTGTLNFAFAPSQRESIALLAFGRELMPKGRETTVVWDAKCLSDPETRSRPGDCDWTQVVTGLHSESTGLWLVDQPSGSGKTVMALVAIVLKLGIAESWQRVQERHPTFRQAMCSSGKLGFTDTTCSRAQLLRAGQVRTMSRVMEEHFLHQLLLAWPNLAEKLPCDLTVEVWAVQPSAQTCRGFETHADAAGRARLVLRTVAADRTLARLVSLAQSSPDTIVLWFMGMKAEDNAMLKVPSKKKRSLDEYLDQVHPADLTFAAGIWDEMMQSSTPVLPGQEPHVANRIVLQATPDKLAAARMQNSHWLREAVHPRIDLLVNSASYRGRPSTRAEMMDIVRSLCRIELCSLPLELRQAVAAEMVPRMPAGLEIHPVRVLPRMGVGRDSLARVTLRDFVSAQLPYQVAGRGVNEALEPLERIRAPSEVAALLTPVLDILSATRARLHQHRDIHLFETARSALVLLQGRLRTTQPCPMYCGADAALVLPCCTGTLCRTCYESCHRCPHCYVPLTTVLDTNALAPRQPLSTDLAELVARPPRPILTTALDALELATRDPQSRVLLMCAEIDDAVSVILAGLPPRPTGANIPPLVSLVTDKVVVRAYQDPKQYPHPMILVCRNTATDVVGTDLGITTALVVVGRLENPSQLVCRVLRPGAGQAGRRIPFIAIE